MVKTIGFLAIIGLCYGTIVVGLVRAGDVKPARRGVTHTSLEVRVGEVRL